MNSLYRIVVVLATIAMAVPAGTSLGQQASAQGVIVPQQEEFDKLSEQFQQDVLGLVAGDPPTEAEPPDPDKLATLFDNYEQETFRIFGADPPTEAEPPDPDLEQPDPDKS